MSPQTQQDNNPNAFFMFQQILERLSRLEAKLDGQDEHYYRKEYIDQRFQPLEEAQISKNQKLGIYATAAIGIVSTLINLLSHVRFQ